MLSCFNSVCIANFEVSYGNIHEWCGTDEAQFIVAAAAKKLQAEGWEAVRNALATTVRSVKCLYCVRRPCANL